MSAEHVAIEELRAWAAAMLTECGMSAPAAEVTVASMLHANRRGLDSHGVVLLAVYVQRLRDGTVRGEARPEIVKRHGALALFDGHLAPGAYTGAEAMQWCCETVKAHGIAAAAVRNSSHFGAASFFSELAAARGCVGFATTNSDPGMAPLGALEPILGTNPLAVASPALDSLPMPSLDIATSVVAQGRVVGAARAGAEIPEGWAIGPDGGITTDPNEALANSVLPMAGHKGFALAFMIDVIAACLSGAEISPDMVAEAGVGHLMIAVDVAAAAGVDAYSERLQRLIEAVHSAPRAQGIDAFMIPGEREHLVSHRRGELIPLDAPTRALLDGLSAECGVPPLGSKRAA